LQIDDLFALDDTDPRAAPSFERNDFHATSFDEKRLEGGDYTGSRHRAKANFGLQILLGGRRSAPPDL
jgi:hypothetical protein